VSIAAFLDASVLYPATLRSVLMYLAAADAFRALWSDNVHREWMAALARDRPDIPTATIARIRSLMEAHAPDAVVSGYEELIPTLTMPDPDDRHVLAAAIHGGAEIIVTANIRDFPADVLAPYKIVAQEPDAFVLGLVEADPESALGAFAADRARLRNPAMSAREYIAAMEHAGLTATAGVLGAFEDRL
jgi:predicted nucleic acid-binding protein